MIGELYFRMKKPSHAIPHLKKAIELDNSSFMPYYLLADCFMTTGALQEAEQTAQKALKIAHFYTSISRAGLSYIYELQNNYEKAIDEAIRSIEYNRNKAGYYRLANLYFESKSYQKVIDSLQHAVGLEKLFPDIHYMRAISFLHLNKKDQAMREYEKLNDIDPSLAEKLYLELSDSN